MENVGLIGMTSMQDGAPAGSKTPWDRVTVVLVTHNSAAVIGACIESVREAQYVIVVDNASDDDTVDIVKRTAPQAQIIKNDVGLGFGNASNQGLKAVTTDYAFHINPDTVVQPGCIETLVHLADELPEAGVLGPKIVAPDGLVDKSFDVALHKREGMSKDRSQEPFPDGPCCTWFLSGAAFFFRMSALRDIDFFDPAIFLYFEDDDISSRFARAGHTLLFVPGAECVHVGGGSIRPSLAKHWEKFYHFSWSRLYYEAKYKGRTRAMALGWREIFRSFGKLLGHALTLKTKKAITDLARMAGSLAYLAHIAASRTTKRARPL